jgi:hypothetical protein
MEAFFFSTGKMLLPIPHTVSVNLTTLAKAADPYPTKYGEDNML